MANDGWTDVPESPAVSNDGWTDVTEPAERKPYAVDLKSKKAKAQFQLDALLNHPDFQSLPEAEKKRLTKAAENETKSEFEKNLGRTYETFAQAPRMAGEFVQMGYGLGKKALAGYAGLATAAATQDSQKAAKVSEAIKNNANLETGMEPSWLAQGFTKGVEWQNREADRTGTEWTKPILEGSLDILGVTGVAKPAMGTKYGKMTPMEVVREVKDVDIPTAISKVINTPLSPLARTPKGTPKGAPFSPNDHAYRVMEKTDPMKVENRKVNAHDSLRPDDRAEVVREVREGNIKRTDMGADEFIQQTSEGRLGEVGPDGAVVKPYRLGEGRIMGAVGPAIQMVKNIWQKEYLPTIRTLGLDGMEISTHEVVPATRANGTPVMGELPRVMTPEAMQGRISTINDNLAKNATTLGFEDSLAHNALKREAASLREALGKAVDPYFEQMGAQGLRDRFGAASQFRDMIMDGAYAKMRGREVVDSALDIGVDVAAKTMGAFGLPHTIARISRKIFGQHVTPEKAFSTIIRARQVQGPKFRQVVTPPKPTPTMPDTTSGAGRQSTLPPAEGMVPRNVAPPVVPEAPPVPRNVGPVGGNIAGTEPVASLEPVPRNVGPVGGNIAGTEPVASLEPVPRNVGPVGGQPAPASMARLGTEGMVPNADKPLVPPKKVPKVHPVVTGENITPATPPTQANLGLEGLKTTPGKPTAVVKTGLEPPAPEPPPIDAAAMTFFEKALESAQKTNNWKVVQKTAKDMGFASVEDAVRAMEEFKGGGTATAGKSGNFTREQMVKAGVPVAAITAYFLADDETKKRLLGLPVFAGLLAFHGTPEMNVAGIQKAGKIMSRDAGKLKQISGGLEDEGGLIWVSPDEAIGKFYAEGGEAAMHREGIKPGAIFKSDLPDTHRYIDRQTKLTQAQVDKLNPMLPHYKPMHAGDSLSAWSWRSNGLPIADAIKALGYDGMTMGNGKQIGVVADSLPVKLHKDLRMMAIVDAGDGSWWVQDRAGKMHRFETKGEATDFAKRK